MKSRKEWLEDYILKYADLGLTVLRLEETSKEVDYAGYDQQGIQRHSYRQGDLFLSHHGFCNSTANLGLQMGITGGTNNVIAIDFDTMAAYRRWEQENPELRTTATQITARGMHVLLQLEMPHDRCYKSDKISIINRSWHIAVEPSIHPDGLMYRWVSAPWDREGIKQVQDITCIGVDLSMLDEAVDDYPEHCFPVCDCQDCYDQYHDEQGW